MLFIIVIVLCFSYAATLLLLSGKVGILMFPCVQNF